MSFSSRAWRRAVWRVAVAPLLTLPFFTPTLDAQQEGAQDQTPPTEARQPAAEDGASGVQRVLYEAFAALERGRKAASPQQAKRELDRALKLFRTVRIQRPDIPDAIFGLAECLREMGRGREAINQYAEYIETPGQRAIVDPDKTVALSHRELGELYLDSQYFPLALKQLLRASELSPSDAKVMNAVARCYEQLRELDEALKYAQLAVSTDRDDPDSHRVLARIQLKRRNYSAADSSSRTALDLAYKNYREQFSENPGDAAAIATYLEFSKFRVDVLKEYLNVLLTGSVDAEPEQADPVELWVALVRRLEDIAAMEQRLALHEAYRLAAIGADQFRDEVRILAEVADLQIKLRMHDQAAETCRTILKLDAGDARARKWLANYEQRRAATQPAGAATPGGQPASRPASEPPEQASASPSETAPAGAADE